MYFFLSVNCCLPRVLIERVQSFCPSIRAPPRPIQACRMGVPLFRARCTFIDTGSVLWQCLGLVSKYLQVPHSNFRKVKFAKVPWQAGLLLVFIGLEKQTTIKHSVWRVSLKSLESTTSLKLPKLTYGHRPFFLIFIEFLFKDDIE